MAGRREGGSLRCNEQVNRLPGGHGQLVRVALKKLLGASRGESEAIWARRRGAGITLAPDRQLPLPLALNTGITGATDLLANQEPTRRQASPAE